MRIIEALHEKIDFTDNFVKLHSCKKSCPFTGTSGGLQFNESQSKSAQTTNAPKMAMPMNYLAIESFLGSLLNQSHTSAIGHLCPTKRNCVIHVIAFGGGFLDRRDFQFLF